MLPAPFVAVNGDPKLRHLATDLASSRYQHPTEVNAGT